VQEAQAVAATAEEAGAQAGVPWPGRHPPQPRL
jgi:hypothetical protein